MVSFISRFLFGILIVNSVQGADLLCQNLDSLTKSYKVCWLDSHKAWVSEDCLDKKCEALNFLKKTEKKIADPKISDSKNPSVRRCHDESLTIEILRAKDGAEQSYCVFKDKSLIDSNAIEMVTP